MSSRAEGVAAVAAALLVLFAALLDPRLSLALAVLAVLLLVAAERRSRRRKT